MGHIYWRLSVRKGTSQSASVDMIGSFTPRARQSYATLTFEPNSPYIICDHRYECLPCESRVQARSKRGKPMMMIHVAPTHIKVNAEHMNTRRQPPPDNVPQQTRGTLRDCSLRIITPRCDGNVRTALKHCFSADADV